MPDDSNKAWGMLFESEAWPLPLRVKENIDILFDSKGSGADSAAPAWLLKVPKVDIFRKIEKSENPGIRRGRRQFAEPL